MSERESLKVGTRVQYSAYALRAARDYWLGQGKYTAKNRAKATYDKQANRRGTVICVFERGVTVGLTVLWDDGTTSDTLHSQLEEAKDNA